MKNVLVFNDSFFEVSQTFVYQQIEALSDQYNVDLLSYQFKNPHGFDLGKYGRYEINRPEQFIGKVTSKLYRIIAGSHLHVDLQSHLKLKSIFSKNTYSAIHAHFGYNGLKILEYAKAYDVPLVTTFHGHDASQMLHDDKYRNKLPKLFDYASAICLVSRHMIDTLEIEPWLEKVHIIPCAIDTEIFSPISRNNSSGKVRIVHAGRITSKKGVPELIHVFAKLNKSIKNLELHIAGTGEELDLCKQLSEKHQLQNYVKFYGAVSHNKVKEILDMADIFVLNSRTADNGDMEGTPVTLLEAMSMGKAVVSTKHAGIPYVIKNGVNGLLAEEKNNDQLEQCLAELIMDENLRSNLERNARAEIQKSYSADDLKQKIESLFVKLTHPELPKYGVDRTSFEHVGA